MTDRMAKVRIARMDPDKDAESQVITYEVPYAEGMRVAQALRYIFEELDGTIAFRNSFCKRGSCGLCIVLVDKKPVMACKAVMTLDTLIEPLSERDLIKDLAVDLSQREDVRSPSDMGD
jgi:succinate dehydrogenase/fumarate reductase-like Fe-S protein